MEIDSLANHRQLVPRLAKVHFELWGALTGGSSLADYEKILQRAASGSGLPMTLVATEEEEALGSVNLVESDLPVREQLTPWLGQLYVFPDSRNRGVGAALVRAAIEEARCLGWSAVYLYTSGTLPVFYEHLGWRQTEHVEYLGRERVVTEIDTSA